jgi:hypothetical protein
MSCLNVTLDLTTKQIQDATSISEDTLARSIVGKGVTDKLDVAWHGRTVIEVQETQIQLKEE